jgi:hypothetical protein
MFEQLPCPVFVDDTDWGDDPGDMNPCAWANTHAVAYWLLDTYDCVESGGGGKQPKRGAPSCTVDVGYLTNVYGSDYSHSYIDVTIAGITKYIEASPATILGVPIPIMQVNITSAGIFNDSSAGIDFWSEQGPNICVDAIAVWQEAKNFPPSLYLLLTSNSNSFISTLLADAGVTSPALTTGPPNAVGWGDPVLGY